MLYVSTRDKNNAVTAYVTLHQDYAPDGGAFVPFRLPSLEKEELEALRDMTFGDCVVNILRRFFPAQLAGSDIDFRIGRSPVRIISVNRRVLVAETWHNLERDYTSAARTVFGLLQNDAAEPVPTDWAELAIRIAMLFGVYTELTRQQQLLDSALDISVNAEDFTTVMAAWYARKMGMPIGTIICCCSARSTVWDLLHHGDCSAAMSEQGGKAMNVERLLYETLGAGESRRYLSGGQKICQLSENALACLGRGLFAAMVGDSRIPAIIGSLYQTGAYLIDPAAAVAFGGLQDYRASTGESRLTLLLSDSDPLDADIAEKATGLSKEELKKRSNTP